MSSKPSKKVHYSETTKGGKSSSSEREREHRSHRHSHKGSRDSGVGSSSASDRASLGTSPNQSPFNSQEIYTQRHNPNALNEALDAANEKIRELEEKCAKLDSLLSQSNKENRTLNREKKDLYIQMEDLKDELEDERSLNEQLRRETLSSPRPSAAPSANTSAARRGGMERRFSRSGPAPPPLVPQPPQSNSQNPFLPQTVQSPTLSRAPTVTYAPTPTTVAYAPSNISYASSNASYVPTPAYTHTQVAKSGSSKKKASEQRQQERMYPNDGNYHPYPV
ncbi:hypothetical protein BGZ60DRAFT_427171 [Tricladium varicosporioides]|nr:hypothetical protein BGZ60DRAFT_427171 [Hymenoscyphus varicosporioides]